MLQQTKPSFNRRYNNYKGFIYNIAYKRTGDEHESKCIMSETFARALENIDDFEEGTNFKAWIAKIAVNLSKDFLKKKKEIKSEKIENVEEKTPESESIRFENIELVRSAMNYMTEKQKEILVMREIEGKSYKEICKELNLKRGTMSSRLFHARVKFRKTIIKLGYDRHD